MGRRIKQLVTEIEKTALDREHPEDAFARESEDMQERDAAARRDYEAKVALARADARQAFTYTITRTSIDGRPKQLTQYDHATKLIDAIDEVLRAMRPDFECLERLTIQAQITKAHGGMSDDSIELRAWTDLDALKKSLGHAYTNLHHTRTSFKR